MYFKATFRDNPKIGKKDWYYRLVESYRNALDEVRQRTVLTVGFMDELSGDQIDLVQEGINNKIKGQTLLFQDTKAIEYVEYLYNRMIKEKKIDVESKNTGKDYDTIDLNSVKTKQVRELGAEWLSLQTIEKLGIASLLESKGWSKKDTSLAISHIVSRTIYPASELKTVSFMHENSAICELTNIDTSYVTKDKLYNISKRLFEEKQAIEDHLSKRTNELFDLQDTIILYDLTNTYFEGEKRNSSLAKYGRSKEKRSDCPLIVLALVVNLEGFIKYSAIYQGNMADCNTLGEMIDNLRISTTATGAKATVVIDAGIATEENLQMIKAKGYEYVCVSRSTLKDYKQHSDGQIVKVQDRKQRIIELSRVQGKNDAEYILKVTSPAKAIKETAMKSQFQQRFEDDLTKIASSLTKKSGVKKYDKVCERIGRLKHKYPSIHRLYEIEIAKNNKDVCSQITWSQNIEKSKQKADECGVYFLKTSHTDKDEKLVWTIYNSIRNIESSFRTLKTDLDLRPIYHKSDAATQAHLHLGLLAYWVVNTIRHQLKQNNIHWQWREIVRVMNTQKCVTTTMENSKEQVVSIRKCSEPEQKAQLIYNTLNLKSAPFIRKKSVVPKDILKKNIPPNYQEVIT